MKNLYGILLMGALLTATSVLGSQPARADDAHRYSEGHGRPYVGGPPPQTTPAQCQQDEEYLRRRDGRLVSRQQLEFERNLRNRILQQPLNQGGCQPLQGPWQQR